MADIRLTLSIIDVVFLDRSKSQARAEGNNAAWICKCEDPIPLVGRCYFQFGHDCHTICPTCDRRYRVRGDDRKRACLVEEQ